MESNSNTSLAGASLDASQFSVSKPKITWTGVGLAAIFWVLYTVLYSLLIARGEDIPLVFALSGQVVANTFLALYSVPVWWLTVREMDRVHWGWVLGTHVVLAPLYAWVGLESYILFFDVGLGADLRTTLGDRYQWIFFANVTVYVVQFVGYHLVRNVQRLRQKEQQATELLAVARERQFAALKAQVNPHFLFNTLNSISATLRHNPEQAREMIAKLSGMMRYALDGSDRDHVPLREELDFTRRYLDLEHHRFSDRLTATIEVDADDETLDTPVPPMILQPLVENALRHGIAPSEEGGTVTVEVTTENDRIHVRVEDTGVGPGDEDPLSAADDSTGLANTDTRLRHTYGPDAGLHTAENTPTGFVVHFSIPRNGVAPN
jgi:two-component system LytT family sensor kinase